MLLKWLFYRIETVSKCFWLRVAMMKMASNLTEPSRLFFQVFALVSDFGNGCMGKILRYKLSKFVTKSKENSHKTTPLSALKKQGPLIDSPYWI